MRVAYVVNSLEGGGAAAPIPALVGVMRAHGCDVRVLALTGRDRRALAAIEQANIPVAIRDGGERDHIAAARWLNRDVGRWQPDLIWTSLTRATLLGQIVGQLHDIDVVSWQHNGHLKRANALLLRLRQQRSLMWIADSRTVASLTQARLGVPTRRIAMWPLFAADAEAPQAAPWQPGKPLRIGSLGRLHANKGYDVLIAALARLKADGFASPIPIEIEIGGDGELRADLMRQANLAGLRSLRFVGFTEPRAFLAGLHLYVQPSRAEGLCIAAHEAMQAGLPILASAVGEMPLSIVEGITGRTVPPGDPAALASGLLGMLCKPENLAAMGHASREHVLERYGGGVFRAAGAAAIAQILQAKNGRVLC